MTATTEVYDGPPDYRTVGRHGLLPETTHDQTERYNFLAHLNRHLAASVLPGIERAYQGEIAPEFRHRHGRDPADRHEVRRSLERHPLYRTWSALRRNTMEMRQQAGLSVVLPQLSELIERTADAADAQSLRLDAAVAPPRYLTAVDHHCMPGSYYTERVAEDVSGAANYDSGLFVTTGGMLGRFADGGGHGMVAFVRRLRPGFAPRRILDLGCGLGHNVLPIAKAFPEARVTAVDVAAPMLRYGAARAASLGVANVEFVQAGRGGSRRVRRRQLRLDPEHHVPARDVPDGVAAHHGREPAPRRAGGPRHPRRAAPLRPLDAALRTSHARLGTRSTTTSRSGRSCTRSTSTGSWWTRASTASG